MLSQISRTLFKALHVSTRWRKVCNQLDAKRISLSGSTVLSLASTNLPRLLAYNYFHVWSTKHVATKKRTRKRIDPQTVLVMIFLEPVPLQTIAFKEFPRLSRGYSHLELISLILVSWENDKISIFYHEPPCLTVWETNTRKIHNPFLLKYGILFNN